MFNEPLALAYKRYNYDQWKYTKKQYVPGSIGMIQYAASVEEASKIAQTVGFTVRGANG